MASSPKIRPGLTLEEFLRLPDNKPYREYIDGRIEVKVSPQFSHGRIQSKLTAALDGFAEPARLGVSLTELRCTFAGRSVVPDIAFLLREHIALNARGKPLDEIRVPPDLHVEIMSPDRRLKHNREKLAHSTVHGTMLGWLIDPYRQTVTVYRPGQEPIVLSGDAILEGEPVLPGFRLAISTVFAWLDDMVP